MKLKLICSECKKIFKIYTYDIRESRKIKRIFKNGGYATCMSCMGLDGNKVMIVW
jgi:hypothetical protein